MPKRNPVEFHFSAEDIERVFVDSNDWQQQFGTAPHGVAGFDAPASRSAGGSPAANDSDNDDVIDEPLVEVDENEGYEDITLEGERVVIEGLPDFLLDSSEHELTDAELLEAQAEARARLLPDFDVASAQTSAAGHEATTSAPSIVDESMLVDAAHAESLADNASPKPDLDSTDRFDVLKHVPDSAYPEIEHADAHISPAVRAARTRRLAKRRCQLSTPITAATAREQARSCQALCHRARRQSPLREEPPPASQPRRCRRVPRPRDRAVGGGSATEAVVAPGRESTTRIAWGVGALLLAIALVAQVTH